MKLFSNNKVTLLFLVGFLFYIQHLQSQNKTIQKTGDVFLYLLPSVALGSSLFVKDYQGTKQYARGFVLNQVITFGLKLAINKPRPDLSNDNAFPSGHTSTTFQSASFIQRRYGWKYGIPAYVIAGFTGYSRIDAKKHDILDVIAGAAIGIGSSYLFTKPYKEQNIQLTLTSEKNGFLLGFNYQF